MNLEEEQIRELQRKDQEHDARLDMQKEKDDEHDEADNDVWGADGLQVMDTDGGFLCHFLGGKGQLAGSVALVGEQVGQHEE